jgi:polysaccharide chain length determinant protein (PEP-CTERM system associated)
MATSQELTFDDYVRILRRRRGMLILPAILGVAAGYLLSLVLPSRYTSHTAVLVEQPAVPDSYVKPVVSEDMNQRLASMQEQILSRTHLQHLVEQLGLYRTVSMEKSVEQLRKSIKVTPLSPMPGTRAVDLPGFNVDVTLEEARLAQQACEEIISMFMEQNLRLHQQRSEVTTQFLAKQLEEAKAKLDEQDAKLAEFQTRYIGELPEDEKTNLALLMGMPPQLDSVTQALNQAQRDKTFTESQLNQQLAVLRPSSESGEGDDFQTLLQQLSNQRKLLASLQGRYTDQHPEVVKLNRDIAQLQKEIQYRSEQNQGQLSEQKAVAPIIEPLQIQQLRAQLHQIEVTINQRKHEQERLQEQIRTLQSRVQLSPVIQQEFKALTRDYQTALDFYNDLLKKRNESQMATELERRQQGEQFRVLDPPSFPERPSFPNRPLFSLGGLGAGLALGLGLVQLSEWRDKSMRTKQDVELHLAMPTLALIPSVDTESEKKNGSSVGSGIRRSALSLRAWL